MKKSLDPYAGIHDPIGQLSTPKTVALLVGIGVLSIPARLARFLVGVRRPSRETNL